MKIRELVEEVGYWFTDGFNTLTNYGFMELTIGQAVFTVLISCWLLLMALMHLDKIFEAVVESVKTIGMFTAVAGCIWAIINAIKYVFPAATDGVIAGCIAAIAIVLLAIAQYGRRFREREEQKTESEDSGAPL